MGQKLRESEVTRHAATYTHSKHSRKKKIKQQTNKQMFKAQKCVQ